MLRRALTTMLLLTLLCAQSAVAMCQARCERMGAPGAVSHPACHDAAMAMETGKHIAAVQRPSPPCPVQVCSMDSTILLRSGEVGVVADLRGHGFPATLLPNLDAIRLRGHPPLDELDAKPLPSPASAHPLIQSFRV